MWGYDHGSWWAWVVMVAGMIAVWGLVLWGVLALVRRGSDASPPRPSPQDILRERFAAGEIDEPELRERLGAL